MLNQSIKCSADGKAVVVDKKLGIFLTSLSRETDRGLVLVVGTVLEERLALLLREILVQSEESDSLIKRNLRGLEARAKAAYCVGGISKRELEMIECIRNIRNDFAHRFVTEKFDGSLESKKGQLFQALTKLLPGINRHRLKSTRQAFEELALHVVCSIWDRPHEFEKSDYIDERE
jgi:hypothetical protein